MIEKCRPKLCYHFVTALKKFETWRNHKALIIKQILCQICKSQTDHDDPSWVMQIKGFGNESKTPLFKRKIKINLCLTMNYPRQYRRCWQVQIIVNYQ